MNRGTRGSSTESRLGLQLCVPRPSQANPHVNQPPQPERRAVTILRRADQACAAVLVAVSLAVIAVFWVREWARHDDRIDVERASSRFIEFQIDVNSAP